MKIKFRDQPRIFRTGLKQDIQIHDQGELELDDNELVTLVSKSGARYDLVSKDWGYYATQSVNVRMRKEGFKTGLVTNRENRLFVVVVENRHRERYEEYCLKEKQQILLWLDECDGKLFNDWKGKPAVK